MIELSRSAHQPKGSATLLDQSIRLGPCLIVEQFPVSRSLFRGWLQGPACTSAMQERETIRTGRLGGGLASQAIPSASLSASQVLAAHGDPLAALVRRADGATAGAGSGSGSNGEASGSKASGAAGNAGGSQSVSVPSARIYATRTVNSTKFR